jgi:hypothetical protein
LEKRIFFISSSLCPSSNATGGSIVLYRHLKRFEQEGYEVIFINCSPVNKGNSNFRQINLEKKFWHPPLRKVTPMLTRIRTRLQAKSLIQTFNFTKGDILIGLLEDYVSYLIYFLAKQVNIPYYLFFHDDNIFNRYFEENILTRRKISKIIENCRYFFVVSEPMKEIISLHGGQNVSVIYPIPDGAFIANRKRIKSEKFTFAVSGMLLPYFFEKTVAKINEAIEETDTNLILIGSFNRDYKNSLQHASKISIYERFVKLYDLFKFLVEETDVIIVFYSSDTDEEIRSRYSFPSRFVEFCHLGIPILIIAPESAAISKWAIKNSWLSYVNNETKTDLVDIINKLKNPDFRLACIKQCRYFAKNTFNPVLIHNRLKLAIENNRVH